MLDILAGLAMNAVNKTNAFNQAKNQPEDNSWAMFQARKKAYEKAQQSGGKQMQEGEQQFLGETSAPLAELATAQQSALASGGKAIQQASGQIAANQAAGGVRGGQASTQMRRAVGEMAGQQQQNLDQMALDEANRRRELRTGLFGQKQARGQTANLAMPGF